MRRSTPASGFLRLALVLAIFLSFTAATSLAASDATAVTVSAQSTTSFVLGTPTTLAASVSDSKNSNMLVVGGTVSFFDNGALIGSAPVTGASAPAAANFVTSVLSVGQHSFTAQYSGATGFDPSSTGSAVAQIIDPRDSSTAISALSPVQVRSAGPVTVTVTDLDHNTAKPVVGAGSSSAISAALHTARIGATATTLSDGTVLIVGGSSDGTVANVLATAEIFDPVAGTFTVLNSACTPANNCLANARFHHSATLLTDGTVLIAGGEGAGPTFLSSTEIYDPTTQTFSSGTAMSAARVGHAATLLEDGSVLIVGGSSDGTATNALASAEIYSAGTFTAVANSMGTARYQATATLLHDGTVLIVGGVNAAGSGSTDTAGASTEIFTPTATPTNGTFAAGTPTLNTARFGHSASLLPDGTVLIAGGTSSGILSKLEIYDPIAKSFIAVSGRLLTIARTGHVATLLNSGLVLIAGGTNDTNAQTSAEEYLPAYDPQGVVSLTSDNTADSLTGCTLALQGTGVSTCTGNVTPKHVNGSLSHAITAHYTFPDWAANTAYSQNELILPLSNNLGGFIFEATQAGTSDLSSEPSFSQIIGTSTVDNSIIWTNVGLPTHAPASAVASLSVTQFPLTVNAVPSTKIYDGTKNDSGTPTSSALTGGDSFTPALTQAFDSKNAGARALSVVTPITITDNSDGDTNAAGDYAISTIPAAGTINTLALQVSAVANTKTYDGTLAAAASPTTTPGLASGDTSGFSETYTSRDAGSGKALTASGVANDGNGGNNYTYSYIPATNGIITRLTLTVTAAANTKVYDATTAATTTPTFSPALGSGDTANFTESYDNHNVGATHIMTPAGSVNDGNGGNNYTYVFQTSSNGVITGRPLTITASTNTKQYDQTPSASAIPTITSGVLQGTDTANFTEAYSDKNAGTSKNLIPQGVITDQNGGANYSYTFVNNTTGVITAKALTVQATANSKQYDANSTSSVTLTDDHLAGDSVTDNFTSATFSDKNVGNAKTVTVNGISLSGTDKNNYTPNTSATTTANITSASLTVTATSTGKVYDGTNTAPVTLADNHLGSDVITDSFTSATFADKNAGVGRTVSVSGISISGTDAGNYTLSSTTATTTASVTPRPLTLTAATDAKTYDGTRSAAASPAFTAGMLAAGDSVIFIETYSDKNAGANKTISPAAAITDGNSGNNYAVTPVNSTGTISPLGITGSTTAQSKVYDATANATANCTLAGVITGDAVACSPTSATFSDKNVGSGKTVTATGLNLNGTDSGNYTVNASAATTANITPASLAVSAAAATKTYDGTASASVTLSDNHVGTDVVSETFGGATFTDKNAGTGKTVNVIGIFISGTDAGNYTFNNTAVATATILPAPLTVTADPQSHIFGSGLPNLTASPSGFVASETLATSGVSGAASCSTGATPLSPVGSYPITCTNGNLAANNYAFASFAPGSLTVGPATTNSVVVSPQSTKNSATFTFIATVAPQFAGVPGGTVTFMDNGTALASSIPLDANGQASFNTTVNELAAGQTHTITAVYNKDDPNFAAATTQVGASITVGAALTTTPGAPIPAQTLQLASSGGSTTYSGLSCGVLDAFGNTVKNTICTATPVGSFTLPATATLTIATSNGNSTTAFSAAPQDVQRVHALESLWLAMPAMVLLPLAIPAETRRKLRQKKALFVIGLLLVLCVVLVSVGCGGGNGFSNPNNQQPGTVGTAATPNGSYVVQITATNQQGQSVAVGSIPLTVAAN